MNTVGKPGRLGDSIRCVVSVSMLTEGWDANTVSHVLGVRAFGTQLLCEQVVGRALRRQSYDLNDDGVFNVEYADVLGVPFDFTAKPVVAPPSVPRKTVHVKAMRPERDYLEIRFPRVSGYRVELPDEIVSAEFTSDSVMTLTTDLVGPTITRNQGIIGEGIDLSLGHTRNFTKLKPGIQSYSKTPVHEDARSGQRADAFSLRSTEAHYETGGWTTALCARTIPIRHNSCTRNWPTWPVNESPRPSHGQTSELGGSRR